MIVAVARCGCDGATIRRGAGHSMLEDRAGERAAFNTTVCSYIANTVPAPAKA